MKLSLVHPEYFVATDTCYCPFLYFQTVFFFFSTAVFQMQYFFPSTTFKEERCSLYFLQVAESQLVQNKISFLKSSILLHLGANIFFTLGKKSLLELAGEVERI